MKLLMLIVLRILQAVTFFKLKKVICVKLKQQLNSVANQLDINDDIKLVMLFGSRAREDYCCDSDVDIAVLLAEDFFGCINPLELKIDLINIFSSELGQECDIVLLNRASPLLNYQVVKYGEVVYKKSDFEYNSFYSLVLRKYFDFKHYLDFHNNLLLKRVKER